MRIQLIWEEAVTEAKKQPVFTVPLALGRELSAIPNALGGQPVSRAVFPSPEISRYHILIDLDANGQLIVEDKSSNGSFLNNQQFKQSRRPLRNKDVLQIGNYNITVIVLQEADPNATEIINNHSTNAYSPETNLTQPQSAKLQPNLTESSTIIFNPDTDILQSQAARTPQSAAPRSSFPPPNIWTANRVSVSALHASSLPVEEIDYVAVGGGMGSFVWVDTIRICGIKPERIAVLSLQTKPYGRYEMLLRNCQIPRYKRIRSGSDSCPDNVWGWPGYALRDAWRAIFSGQVVAGLGYLWQVFSEPAFADTYTPRGEDVFSSMDREADRIGWNRMVRYGSVRSIRQTEDGRYVIAYSASKAGHQDYRFLLARYIHLATGYPAIKLLDDLREYRQKTGDLKSVIHGYEPHDYVYEHLESRGGTVIVRGAGIVASQILDRLYEARKKNSRISVIHLSRAPKLGNKFGMAQRHVENHWEFQPFNWPKGTWGGDMRSMLESADPLRRRELLDTWHGTTTASRRRWRGIVSKGIKEGWYSIKFGQVERVERNSQGKPVTYIRSREGTGLEEVAAEYVIDCTGLISDPAQNPLLDDMIVHYNLPINPYKGLHVENDFEIKAMRNDRGRMYAAGIMTLGGPYAPVDTFLGLQYAAHRSAESLVQAKAPGIHYLEGIGSLWQWFKWATNQTPS